MNTIGKLTITAVVGASILGSSAAASAHSASAHSATRPITVKVAAKQYVAIITPVNTALTTLVGVASAWTDSTTGTAAAASAAPAEAALKTAQLSLTKDRWPDKTKSHVKKVVKDTAKLNAYLSALSAVNTVDFSSWAAQFTRDSSKLSTAVDDVRNDLGLRQRLYTVP